VSDFSEAAPDGELQRRMRDATLAALPALGGNARIDAILGWVVANGAFAPSELTRSAAGAPCRLLDYALLLALTSLREDGLVDNLPCARWALADPPAAGAMAAGDADADADRRLAELGAMLFADYLQTPEWLRTRTAVLERTGGCCKLDTRHREHVEVHHCNRERLGAELDSDLVVLCGSCYVLYRRAYGLVRHEDVGGGAPRSRPASTTGTSERLALTHAPRRRSIARRIMPRPMRPERPSPASG
jgi:hypothetical protein